MDADSFLREGEPLGEPLWPVRKTRPFPDALPKWGKKRSLRKGVTGEGENREDQSGEGIK